MYEDVLGKFADFVELEEDAKRIMEWQADVVPGPLQTEEYAAAVFRHAWPEDRDDAIARRVDLRIERQKRVQDGPASFWASLDESALMRPVGGRSVMANQLDHLVEQAARNDVTIQVLPTDLTGHVAESLNFTRSLEVIRQYAAEHRSSDDRASRGSGLA